MARNIGSGTTDDNLMKVKNDREKRKRNRGSSGTVPGAGSGQVGTTGYTGPGALEGSGSQTTFASGTPGISQGGGWWGSGLNQSGQAAADDPYSFWAAYGGPANKGWDPYGSTQGFFENTFNPQGLMNMAYPGGGFKGYESKMAGATNVANSISGSGHFMNIDPHVLVGNVMQALASGDMKSIANMSPEMANILTSGQYNAGGTIQALMNFLEESLKGAIPPEALDQLHTMIQNAGREYFQRTTRAGNENMGSPMQAIQFITQRLGPTLGF
jgi:hypothetical protein